MSWLYLALLFAAKVVDNMLSTAKTILVQRNKSILAGVALGLSNAIYLLITKDVVMSDNYLSLVVVSVAAGVGCCLAVGVNNRLSKERTYVNVIMSNDFEAMKAFRDFLVSHKITNVAADTYSLDWNEKTITITAYAETKEESSLISEYIAAQKGQTKFKRIVQKGLGK